MQDITNALNANKTVTIHEKAISYKGWTGSGYAIVDNTTGAGAYLISGGANGAVGYWNGSAIGRTLALAAVFNDLSVSKIQLYGTAILVGLLGGLIVGTLIAAKVQNWGETEKGCLILGFITSFKETAIAAGLASYGFGKGSRTLALVTAMAGYFGYEYSKAGQLPEYRECI